ncbi:hypothetical protein ACI0YY_000948 [Cronobacter sakazakii]
MSKATYLDDLIEAWAKEKHHKARRCASCAGKTPWERIAQKHNARIVRAGNLNRAGRVAAQLKNLDFWSHIIAKNIASNDGDPVAVVGLSISIGADKAKG